MRQIVGTVIFIVFYSLSNKGQCLELAAPDELAVDMTYADVLGKKGAPKEKISMEAKRRDLWIYDKFSVVFKEGKVLQITDNYSEEELKLSVKKDEKIKVIPEKTGHDPEEVDKIFKDLVGDK